jgi:hypothetical protein
MSHRIATVGVVAALSATLVCIPAGPAAAATQTCFISHGRADRICTPGARNPDVTQATIHQTVCVSGYSGRIRPPSSYTTGLKNQQKVSYGEAAIPNSELEEDHLIPLSVGGAPRDPRNLWPEPRNSRATGGEAAEDKDVEEFQLFRDLCAGRITLAAAQAQILAHWTH